MRNVELDQSLKSLGRVRQSVNKQLRSIFPVRSPGTVVMFIVLYAYMRITFEHCCYYYSLLYSLDNCSIAGQVKTVPCRYIYFFSESDVLKNMTECSATLNMLNVISASIKQVYIRRLVEDTN